MAPPPLPVPEAGRLAYDVVDVFTDAPFGGNPLAVVHGADDLSTRQLQRLAREFNLSETAFPVTASPEQAAAGVTYRLRIFTPMAEMPYAGHPSVGTAWLLRERGLVTGPQVVQACGAGLLPLDLTEAAVRLSGGEPSWSEPLDPAAALAAVRLAVDDLDPIAPPLLCGVGVGFLLVPVAFAALSRCRPDPAALAGFAHPVSDATGVYVVAWDPGTRSARVRMFAGDLGVPEDPATGSAAGSLAVWLAVNGLVGEGETTFIVEQGIEMGRPSRMVATVRVVDGRPVATSVAGQAVHVSTGQVLVPPA
jgi:trans-2,3-dihydro-3-hydroxyanthranilate isomerase